MSDTEPMPAGSGGAQAPGQASQQDPQAARPRRAIDAVDGDLHERGGGGRGGGGGGGPRAWMERPPPFLPALVGAAVGAGLLFAMTATVRATVHGAAERLQNPKAATADAQTKVATADESEEKYCTPNFKEVLQRVLNACGLVGGESRRGCQPADVKTFASISDDDFNALFTPLKDRGAVIMFDDNSDVLDPGAKELLEKKWEDRKGARYFFIVARASRTGTPDANRQLSHRRANSVQLFLQQATNDPDLEKQVGLLWLGNEFAQLTKDYCDWPNSRPGKPCNPDAINRSAFVSWVDCRL